MVCTTTQAGSTLAHKRWGTRPKTNKTTRTGRTRTRTPRTGKKRSRSGFRIKEREREAPGVAERRNRGAASTHLDDFITNLESRAERMDAEDTSVVDLRTLGLKKRNPMGGSTPIPPVRLPYTKKKSAKSTGNRALGAAFSRPSVAGPINMLIPRRKK